VTLTCILFAKPTVTSLFWIIAANGSTLTDSDTDKRQFQAHLHVRKHRSMLLHYFNCLTPVRHFYHTIDTLDKQAHC